MALERIPVTSATNPPVQITRVGSGSSVISYQVPEGRVFRGYFTTSSSGVFYFINGATPSYPIPLSDYTPEFTFIAGTNVRMTNSAVCLIGVESDA